jgi:hypothetical protein
MIDGDSVEIAGTWSVAGHDVFRRRKDGPSAIPIPWAVCQTAPVAAGSARGSSVDGVLASRT